MASGTSVIGSQGLTFGSSVLNRNFYLIVSGGENDPPYRIGFLYLVKNRASGSSQAPVVVTRPIYRSGVTIRVPFVGFGDSDRLGAWAEWNVAGLSWTADFYG